MTDILTSPAWCADAKVDVLARFMTGMVDPAAETDTPAVRERVDMVVDAAGGAFSSMRRVARRV
jgi:hypothetical protein